MEFELMNSQGAIIPSVLSDVGKTFPFTIQNYAHVTSYSRMRIHLVSKKVKSSTTTTNSLTAKSFTTESKSSDDDELQEVYAIPVKRARKNKTPSIEVRAQSLRENESLIGSSSERKSLRDQQDLEYEISLRADKMKEEKKVKKLSD